MKRKVVVVVLALIAGLSGCAAERTVIPPAAELPAAQGETKLTRDANGNAVINLKVKHLAPPQKLQPPASVYVVWVETQDKLKFNLGQLRVDENLRGEITGVTPFKDFRLVVTAEEYPTVTQPSSRELLRTAPMGTK